MVQTTQTTKLNKTIIWLGLMYEHNKKRSQTEICMEANQRKFFDKDFIAWNNMPVWNINLYYLSINLGDNNYIRIRCYSRFCSSKYCSHRIIKWWIIFPVSSFSEEIIYMIELMLYIQRICISSSGWLRYGNDFWRFGTVSASQSW